MNISLLIKDIKLLVRDFKFQIFFLILASLFIISAFSAADSYKTVSEDYKKHFDAHQNRVFNKTDLELNKMIQERESIAVFAKPSPGALFNVNDSFPIGMTNGVMFFEPRMVYGEIVNEVFRINWFFIFSVMISFIMLILSFESVSKEKRSGTMRLLSIYGFKRQNVLWSKYISYMILYLIIIIPPAMVSMILFFSLTATWDMLFMLRFFTVILISIPFASFFTLIGMFISMLKNYRNAIVIIVFIWLLIVIIIPQSANVFGETFSPIKTSTEYTKLQNETWDNEFNEWCEKYESKMMGAADISDGIRPKAFYVSDEKRNAVRQQRIADEDKQWKTIKSIARISPFVQFEEVADIIFETGSYLYTSMQEKMRTSLALIRNLIIEQDKNDTTSLHFFFSNATQSVTPYGTVAFSGEFFEQPELLFTSDITADDFIDKSLKILLKLLPIFMLNLLLIILCIIKLDKLDIR
jgi:ABC-type transport system involved in multi-copper enzyme maturation permease subunit